MVVQIIPRAEKQNDRFAQAIIGGLQGYQQGKASKEQQFADQMKNKQQQEFLRQMQQEKYGLEGDLSKRQAEEKYNQQLNMLQKLGLGDIFNNQEQGFGDIINNPSQMGQPNQMPQEMAPQQSTEIQNPQARKLIPENKIAAVGLVNPEIAHQMQKHNEQILSEARHSEDIAQKRFESERGYQTGFSKEQEKEAENLRQVVPRKEMALNFARNAIETGDLTYFSPDKLADATGIDLFRTAKGAQLNTAAKENLLNNITRVSAKAQNVWFEQRLNSIFPKIGQSKEANLTAQEMLEGELAMDKEYLKEFDRISKQDEDQYGYVKKDASKRARDAVKPREKFIFQRTFYRMKDIEEHEKGISELKKQVGKNVSRGTPLTINMARLYKEKFKDKALEVAKKNGYYIPSAEEFQDYMKPFSEVYE
jgi:hypothetical protein